MSQSEETIGNEIPLDDAIDKLADHFSVPRPLWRRLVGQESGGNVNVGSSPKGARGLFQIMPGTARNIRKPDGNPINPNDPLEAAYGGLKLLSDNYKQFRPQAQNDRHAWGMALAGYHGNPKNVLKDVRRGGVGIPDQDDGAINTQDYVASILKDIPEVGAGEVSKRFESPSLDLRRPSRSPQPVDLRPEAAPPVVEPGKRDYAEGGAVPPSTPVFPQSGRTDEFAPPDDAAAYAREQQKFSQIDTVGMQAVDLMARQRQAQAAAQQRASLMQRSAARRAQTQQQSQAAQQPPAVDTGIGATPGSPLAGLFQREKPSLIPRSVEQRLGVRPDESYLGRRNTPSHVGLGAGGLRRLDDPVVKQQRAIEQELRRQGPGLPPLRTRLLKRGLPPEVVGQVVGDSGSPSVFDSEARKGELEARQTINERIASKGPVLGAIAQQWPAFVGHVQELGSKALRMVNTAVSPGSYTTGNIPKPDNQVLNDVSDYLAQRAEINKTIASYNPPKLDLPEKVAREIIRQGYNVAQIAATVEATGLSLPVVMAGESVVLNSDKDPATQAKEAAKAYAFGWALTKLPVFAQQGLGKVPGAVGRTVTRYPEAAARTIGAGTFGGLGAADAKSRGADSEEVIAEAVGGALIGGGLAGGGLKRIGEHVKGIPETAIKTEWLPEPVRTAAARAKGYEPVIVQTNEATPRFASVYYKSAKEQFVQEISPEQAASFTRAAKGEKARPFIEVEPTDFDRVAGFSTSNEGAKRATTEVVPMKRQLEAETGTKGPSSETIGPISGTKPTELGTVAKAAETIPRNITLPSEAAQAGGIAPEGPQALARIEPKQIVRHSDPNIDGGEVVGRAADGRLKVQNKEGGISLVQDPRKQGNREAALTREVVDAQTPNVEVSAQPDADRPNPPEVPVEPSQPSGVAQPAASTPAIPAVPVTRGGEVESSQMSKQRAGQSDRLAENAQAPQGEPQLKDVADLRRLIDEHGGTLYVRWSESPQGDIKRGYSMNYAGGAGGQRESGLSAKVLTSDMSDATLLAQINAYSHFSGSPNLFVGERAGTDADGAATISSARLVGSLKSLHQFYRNSWGYESGDKVLDLLRSKGFTQGNDTFHLTVEPDRVFVSIHPLGGPKREGIERVLAASGFIRTPGGGFESQNQAPQGEPSDIVTLLKPQTARNEAVQTTNKEVPDVQQQSTGLEAGRTAKPQPMSDTAQTAGAAPDRPITTPAASVRRLKSGTYEARLEAGKVNIYRRNRLVATGTLGDKGQVRGITYATPELKASTRVRNAIKRVARQYEKEFAFQPATEFQKTGHRRTFTRSSDTLWQFVQKSGGIAQFPNDMHAGELRRLTTKASRKIGLLNQGNRQGSQRYTAEYMMDSANAAGYRDEHGEPFSNIGGFILAIAEDAAGLRAYRNFDYANEYDFEKEYLEYVERVQQEYDAEASFDAFIGVQENERGGELYDLIESGRATREEINELRNLAKSYGVAEQDVDSLIEHGRSRAPEAKLGKDSPESGQEAGSTEDEVDDFDFPAPEKPEPLGEPSQPSRPNRPSQQLGFVSDTLEQQSGQPVDTRREAIALEQKTAQGETLGRKLGDNYSKLQSLQADDVDAGVQRIARHLENRAARAESLPEQFSDVLAALRKLADLRRARQTVADYLNQAPLFGDRELTPQQERVLQALDRDPLSVLDETFPEDKADEPQAALFTERGGLAVESAGMAKKVYYAGTAGGKRVGRYYYLTDNPSYAKNFGEQVARFSFAPKKPLDLTSAGERSIGIDRVKSLLKEQGVDVADFRGDPSLPLEDQTFKPLWMWIRKFPELAEKVKAAGYDSITHQETFSGKGKRETTHLVLDETLVRPIETVDTSSSNTPGSETREPQLQPAKPSIAGVMRAGEGGFHEGIEERHSGLPLLRSLFGNRPRADTVAPASESPTVEARMKAAEGIQPPSVIERAREGARNVYRSFKRTFPEIDPNKDDVSAVVNDTLRQYMASPSYAKALAYDALADLTRNLGKNRMKVFSRAIQLPDILKDIENGKYEGKSLPFGYESKEQVERDLARYQEVAESTPAIKDALERRAAFVRSLTEHLVRLDLLPREVLDDPRYYHRQVMAYVGDPAWVGTGSRDIRLKEKGFQKGRIGGGDFNTRYAEAEFEWVSQAISLISRKETLDRVKQVADLKPALDLQAKVWNAANTGTKTWEDFIPETHTVWQPTKGNHFFPALTIAERTLNKIFGGTKQFEEADVRQILTLGGKREQWVLPKEIAKTLDDFQPVRDEGPVDNLWVQMQSSWKQWVLLNPLRALKYNLNNLSGDLDIALAYDPRILRHYYSAARALWSYQIRGLGNPALKAEVQDALKRGVVDSGLTISEVPDINRTGAFRTLTSDDPNIIQKGIQYYWNGVKGFTTWRENTLRLAAFRHFKGQIAKGKTVYGASSKSQIDAIKDPEDRAAKLARELIGDYGSVSVAGQWIRRHLIPFYSWTEINAPRYARLMRNLPDEGRSSGRAGASKAAGTAVRTAAKALALGVKASTLFILAQLWNHEMFPDEEKKLRREGRENHIILGTNDDGSIRTLRVQGALADALEWFGASDYPSDIRDVASGKSSVQAKVAQAPKEAANKIIQGLEPFTKTTMELALGRSAYPSIFREGPGFQMQGRPIRDRGEYAARVFSLDSLYRRVTGRPRPKTANGLMAIVDGVLTYRTDPGEAAYWEIRGKVMDWAQDRGREFSLGADPTERGNSLYYFKQATKWSDEKAAKKWLGEYQRLGGTEKGMEQSIRMGHPLGMIKRDDWQAFVDSLSPEDKEALKMSAEWYKRTYGGVAEVEKPTGARPPRAPREPRKPRQPVQPLKF